MLGLVREVRFAARTLVRSRFVTSLAVLAFALGIGVTSAVFSIFNGVLLKPLPFPEADELVAVYDTQPACATCPASYPKYMDWKTRNTVFSAIGGSMQVSYRLSCGPVRPIPTASSPLRGRLSHPSTPRSRLPRCRRWTRSSRDRWGSRG